MNFLAHAYLASPDEALIVGGVVGDWIKGPLPGKTLDPALLQGVALHRAIDAFADREPAFLRSRARISAARRRWSGVLIDMYYDHLLAANWAEWHAIPLAEFNHGVYASLHRHGHLLPEDTRPAMQLMASEDWLGTYASDHGLSEILARMSRRARSPNPLADAVEELVSQREAFLTDFIEFLPAAQRFAQDWISQAPPIPASA